MSSDRVEAAREAYFEAGRYIRGDGMYQALYNKLETGAHNARFMWLYEIYSMWHTQRVFMGKSLVVARAKRAGIDAEFADEVATSLAAAVHTFHNLTASLALNKGTLLDVCLNKTHYRVLCLQLIPAATALLHQLDSFMDTLLFHLKDDVSCLDFVMPLAHTLGWQDPNLSGGSASSSPRSGGATPVGVPKEGRRASSGTLPLLSGSCPTSPKPKSVVSPKVTGKRLSLASLGRRLSLTRGAPLDTPRSPRHAQ